MKLTLSQQMLAMALAVSVVTLWISAADKNWTCVIFLGETVLSAWLLYGSLHKAKEKPPYRTEEEY